ncbi:hypothetical protein TTHT_0281 [Thermotomaculum hydrothermale]|uniref:LVIVD repeat protein n=1 Tax=Thermotomaculum hydrothermale TaxID=981385 RepID=A0A7R6PSN4_9BACT|nr:hypothetical protein [Thermotomaculum hydrothermale]BBB31902.1 hypothetical protein TTHT_0281 [Thermotomaculum hydrothermale]
MKTLFSKILAVMILLFFFTTSTFAISYKLGMFEPVHHGYFAGSVNYNNYNIAVSLYGEICVYDVSNNEYELVNSIDCNFKLSSYSLNPVVYQHYMYIPTRQKLLIFDLSELPEIKFVKSYPLDGSVTYVYSIAKYGNILALGGISKRSALLLSLEDPENPVELSLVETNSTRVTKSVDITDKYLITASLYEGLSIWDISDVYNPVLIKEFDIPKMICAYIVNNDYIIISDNYRLKLINISNPENIGDPVEIYNDNIGITGVFTLNQNLLIFNINKSLFCNLSELSNPSNINWKIDNLDFYCVNTNITDMGGGIYKIFCRDYYDSKTIFEINDSSQSITRISSINGEDFRNDGDIVTYNNYLYTVTYGKGIAIYRIGTDDKLELIKTDRLNNTIFNPTGLKDITITSSNKSTQHYLLVNDTYKFVIADLSDPENPSVISSTNAYIRSYCYSEPYLFVYYDSSKEITIFDLSDVSNPQQVSTLELTDSQQASIYYYNDYLYVGKYIIDVSDKANPQVVSDTTPAIKLTGLDDYLFCWPTSTSNTLKILKLTDPLNPEEVQTIYLGASYVYSMNLFTENLPMNDMVVCSFNATNATLPKTVIIKYNSRDEKFDIRYFLDSEVKGIAFGSNYAFVSQIGKAPLALFGLAFSIPHIANTWGWETDLVLDNIADRNDNITYYLEDGIKTVQKTTDISPYEQKTIPLAEGQCGEVIMPFSSYLAFKVSYHHTEEHGIAEFTLNYFYDKSFTLYTPQYLSSNLTWMGLATANCEDDVPGISLDAYDNTGNLLERANYVPHPMERYASVLSNIYTQTDWQDIAKVRVESNGFFNGLTISGNGNSQLLFTPAVYDSFKNDTRYLPHIDVKGYWNTYLVLDNPTDSDITINLILYSQGNEVVNENKTVPANSNLTILLNDYADKNVDCGKISNCGSELVSRLAYRFNSTGATAEFLINGYEHSYFLALNLPAYRADVLTWWGIALMNPNDSAVTVTLKAYANGQVIDTATVNLNPHTKMADLLENIFTNLNGQTVERVIAQTSTAPILGLNICGSNQDRYLFTKAFFY